MPRCWIALGGNKGRVGETFRNALSRLSQQGGVEVLGVSQNYTTSPVGMVAGSPFLNAAAELQTILSPQELLVRLQSVETFFGRVRTLRWGPRTLDLDLLFYGDQGATVLESSTLILPHPHLWYRRFVLDPLLEIAPDLRHPITSLSIEELVQRVERRPLTCALQGGNAASRDELRRQAMQAFPDTFWPMPSSCNELLCFWLGGEPAWNTLPVQSRINVPTFPTQAWETLRDVLTAALDKTRLVAELG